MSIRLPVFRLYDSHRRTMLRTIAALVVAGTFVSVDAFAPGPGLAARSGAPARASALAEHKLALRRHAAFPTRPGHAHASGLRVLRVLAGDGAALPRWRGRKTGWLSTPIMDGRCFRRVRFTPIV